MWVFFSSFHLFRRHTAFLIVTPVCVELQTQVSTLLRWRSLPYEQPTCLGRHNNLLHLTPLDPAGATSDFPILSSAETFNDCVSSLFAFSAFKASMHQYRLSEKLIYQYTFELKVSFIGF